MPVPLAPYPTPPPAPAPAPPYTSPPANGAQSQLVCSGCRNLLLYPVGATSVCCAVCNAVTAVPPPGTEMAQLVCGGCHTLLMYIRGATSVQCSCCHTVNLALEGCTCELWELQDAVNVSIWSKICQMCGMQFCDIRWGPGEHPRTEIQQLKVIIHYYCKMLRTSLGLHLKLQEFSSNISSLLVRRENFLAPSHV